MLTNGFKQAKLAFLSLAQVSPSLLLLVLIKSYFGPLSYFLFPGQIVPVQLSVVKSSQTVHYTDTVIYYLPSDTTEQLTDDADDTPDTVDIIVSNTMHGNNEHTTNKTGQVQYKVFLVTVLQINSSQFRSEVSDNV